MLEAVRFSDGFPVSEMDPTEQDRIDPRDPDVRVTPMPPYGEPPRLPKFVRKAGDIRKDIIRAYVRRGESDPLKIAKSERCTKELILYYARRMEDIAVEIYQPKPGVRSKARIVLKDPSFDRPLY
jgi:hypothetical protein